MQCSRAARASVYGVALMLCLVAGSATPTGAQTISDLDTLRIANVTNVFRKDEFDLDIIIRNSVALGAFSFRLRYDPWVIEPIPDTAITGVDTTIGYSLQLLRGAVYDSISVSLPEPGVYAGFIGDPAALPPSPLQLGTGPAARARWRVRPTARTGATDVAFEDDPQFPNRYNAFFNLNGSAVIKPVRSAGAVVVELACDCVNRGDVNENSIAFEVGDAVMMTNYLFRDAFLINPPTTGCDVNPADIDCNGRVDVVDLLRIFYVITGDFPVDQGLCPPCLPTEHMLDRDAENETVRGGSR